MTSEVTSEVTSEMTSAVTRWWIGSLVMTVEARHAGRLMKHGIRTSACTS